MTLLDRIKHENDIKQISRRHYDDLANEIRQFLMEKVSIKGGHLASNLGAVELTMALHLCMNFPTDKLIFDVGHQAYTHKLLTGRKEGFDTLRDFEGMSGFPKTMESDCDAFNTGHSSTSISAAMGYAIARDLNGTNEKVAAVIGDGSLTGGMAYEALNSLAQYNSRCVIILNDNDMSIDKNVGGLSNYLNDIRVGTTYNDIKLGIEHSLSNTSAGKKVVRTLKRSKDKIKQILVPGSFFEELGLTYVGPIDGHNIEHMVTTFRKAFSLNKPIIIHVKTKKGKGYKRAEKHPAYYHGIGSFDLETGKCKDRQVTTYTDVFANHLVTLGKTNSKLVGITAAMSVGTGLNKFANEFPKRMYDVGIAEQHAVTFAAGLASAGMIPVVAIYSSFLQRAYDQILHDVCLQNLHVIFAIDRSGLVGKDGETHQGIYDTSFLSHMPGMTIVAPKNKKELEAMMDYAVNFNGPIAIKYSRGEASNELSEFAQKIEYGKSEIIYKGSKTAIIFCGNMIDEALNLYKMLSEDGENPTLVNARFVSSVDEEMLEYVCENHDRLIIFEENIKKGGYGEMVLCEMTKNKKLSNHKNMEIINASIPDTFVKQGSVSELRKYLEIDAESIYKKLESDFEKRFRKVIKECDFEK